MRAPEALLLDIRSSARRIAAYVEGMSRDEFLADDKTKAACTREIEIIGEAANRLPSAFRDAHSDIPWGDLIRLRNLYIHVYERIRYDRVWYTVIQTVPDLASKIEPLIPPEPSADSSSPSASPDAPSDET